MQQASFLARENLAREKTPMKVLPSPTWTPVQYTPEYTPIQPGVFFLHDPPQLNPMEPARFDAAKVPKVPRPVVMSKGTVGHPHTCKGLGCKFASKERGCKEGQDCTYCHLCPWRRSSEKAKRV